MKMAPGTSGDMTGATNASALGPGAASTDKSVPKDARVMVAILKDMGIVDFEPRVVNQLMEFAYRYITTVLEDSRVLSSHARKKAVDLDDVKLAVQLYTDHHLTSPPTRDILLDVASRKNSTPLPMPKTSGGLHLPPERFCLTNCNYKLKSVKRKGGARSGPYAGSGGPSGGYGVKSQGKLSTAPAFTVNAMPTATAGAVLKPTIKINAATTAGAGPKIQIQPQGGGQPLFSMTVPPGMETNTTVKQE